jgi:hypothetical protein
MRLISRIHITSIALTSLLLGACGPKVNSNSTDFDGARDTSSIGPGSEMVSINLAVAQQSGFSLASSSAFTMALTGCESGLTYGSITQNVAKIDVYKNDRGCRIELIDFESSNATYIPDGDGFGADWSENRVANYKNASDAADKLRVVIQSQLSNPVVADETVVFSFTEARSGAGETLSHEAVGNQNSLSVNGQIAPEFNLTAVSFLGIAADSGGAGQFSFGLDCEDPVVGTSCNGLEMTSIRYRLIKNESGGDLTIEQAAALFPNAESGTAVTAGALTAQGFTIASINGPGQLISNRDMILVLSGNGSFRYFTIDVALLSY